jgi:hypothetical protein
MRFYEHYDPLPEPTTQIRVLDILPGSAGQPLCTELRVVNIADGPFYSAISYTWGTSECGKLIWVNENGCDIPQNLWSVLCRVRERWGVVSLWVDALCIDQGNNDEKTCQVQLMGSIYAKAANTFIWLGLEADDSTEVFDFIDDYGSGHDRGLLRSERSIANAMASLCRREYWSRAWIRQEILNSRRKTVLCGPAEANWSDFSHLFNYPDLKDLLRNTDASIFLANSRGSDVASEESEPLTLQTLVKAYGMSKASDIRDRIYALISLASDCRDKPDALRPDYDLSCHELFFKVLSFCRAELSYDFRLLLRGVLEINKEQISELAIDSVTKKMSEKTPGEEVFGFDPWYQGWLRSTLTKSMSTDNLRSFCLSQLKLDNYDNINCPYNILGAESLAPCLFKPAPMEGDRVYLAYPGWDGTRWDNIGLILRRKGQGSFCAALVLIRVIKPSRVGEETVVETNRHFDWLQGDEFHMQEYGRGFISSSAVNKFLHRLNFQGDELLLDSSSEIESDTKNEGSCLYGSLETAVGRFLDRERKEGFANLLASLASSDEEKDTDPSVMQRIVEFELEIWKGLPDHKMLLEALDREIALRRLLRTMETFPNSDIVNIIRWEYEDVQQPVPTQSSKAHLLQLLLGPLWRETSFYREFGENVSFIVSSIHEKAIARLRKAINGSTGFASSTLDRISELKQAFDVISYIKWHARPDLKATMIQHATMVPGASLYPNVEVGYSDKIQ